MNLKLQRKIHCSMIRIIRKKMLMTGSLKWNKSLSNNWKTKNLNFKIMLKNIQLNSKNYCRIFGEIKKNLMKQTNFLENSFLPKDGLIKMITKMIWRKMTKVVKMRARLNNFRNNIILDLNSLEEYRLRVMEEISRIR